MNRRDFLEHIGIGAAFALTASCLGSCKKTATPTSVDFTLDLSSSANANLKNNGGYIISNNVVVARTISGGYAAATITCSHEGNNGIIFDGSSNQFFCTAHGARFSVTGAGANQNGRNGLTVYNTSLSGTSLRVYS